MPILRGRDGPVNAVEVAGITVLPDQGEYGKKDDFVPQVALGAINAVCFARTVDDQEPFAKIINEGERPSR